jgi:Rrf2 family protein
MRMSDGVEWAAHCCVLLAVVPPGSALPASRLAEYHGVPAAYLAKQLQALARAGLVESTKGPAGGYRLARGAADITMLDVVEAIEGSEPAFQCAEIRRRGPSAVPAREYRALCAIHVAMNRADHAWRNELRDTSIEDLLRQVGRDASPKGLVKAANWLQEVLG